jgi:hypothetical protein
MSIIHEALKKTGSTAGEKTARERQGAGSRPMRPEVQVHKRAASKGRSPLFVVIACLLVAAPFLLPMLSPSPAPGVSARETSNVQGQFAIEEAPHPAQSAPSSPWRGFSRPAGFVLSGVVYSEKESYCLINGLVLRQGERVGTATVERILPDQVTLDVGGEKIILPVTVS